MKEIPVVMMLVAASAGCESDRPDALDEDGSDLRLGSNQLSVTPIGRFVHGAFTPAGGVAEIVAHDPTTQRLLVVNGQTNAIDVLDMSDPRALTLVTTIDIGSFGGGVQSVASHEGVGVAAIQAFVATDPGSLVFFDVATGAVLDVVPAGALPDMVEFTRDGKYVLSADEGESSPTYDIDPPGSVTIADLRFGFPAAARQVTFEAFDAAVPPGVRIGKPGALASTDFEPEFLTISADSTTAWVTLQENNAIAVVDIASAQVTRVFSAGTSDHSAAGHGIDASDRDGAIRIASWPVRGLRMPDGIASFRLDPGGPTYLITANEGDRRERIGFSDEARVGASTVVLDPVAFPDAATLKASANLGRLKIVSTEGDTDGDGDYDELYSFGGRSFSIFDGAGNLLFDSGDQLEQLTARLFPANFNASHDSNTFDSRSDDKGPEPEGVVVGRLFGRQLAFVALERISGIAIYDVTNPAAPTFVQYAHSRDFSVTPGTGDAGDLGPEGITLIAEDDSPTGQPLLVVGYEVSGTTRVYEITRTIAER